MSDSDKQQQVITEALMKVRLQSFIASEFPDQPEGCVSMPDEMFKSLIASAYLRGASERSGPSPVSALIDSIDAMLLAAKRAAPTHRHLNLYIAQAHALSATDALAEIALAARVAVMEGHLLSAPVDTDKALLGDFITPQRSGHNGWFWRIIEARDAHDARAIAAGSRADDWDLIAMPFIDHRLTWERAPEAGNLALVRTPADARSGPIVLIREINGRQAICARVGPGVVAKSTMEHLVSDLFPLGGSALNLILDDFEFDPEANDENASTATSS